MSGKKTFLYIFCIYIFVILKGFFYDSFEIFRVCVFLGAMDNKPSGDSVCWGEGGLFAFDLLHPSSKYPLIRAYREQELMLMATAV